jgi:hypothetical protein
MQRLLQHLNARLRIGSSHMGSSILRKRPVNTTWRAAFGRRY